MNPDLQHKSIEYQYCTALYLYRYISHIGATGESVTQQSMVFASPSLDQGLWISISEQMYLYFSQIQTLEQGWLFSIKVVLQTNTVVPILNLLHAISNCFQSGRGILFSPFFLEPGSKFVSLFQSGTGPELSAAHPHDTKLMRVSNSACNKSLSYFPSQTVIMSKCKAL